VDLQICPSKPKTIGLAIEVVETFPSLKYPWGQKT